MNKSREDRSRFRNIVTRASSWYSKGPDAAWIDRNSTEWMHQLRAFDLDAVSEAFNAARKESPDWFPSLGKVEAYCRSIVARERDERDEARRRAGEYREDQAYREYLGGIPAAPDLQQQWISAAPNECERLGRQWAVESKTASGDPGRVISTTEASRRIEHLIAAMDT